MHALYTCTNYIDIGICVHWTVHTQGQLADSIHQARLEQKDGQI